jgi:UDP-N-acetyl-D-mannosaminuronic acid transferase (WecB/TagA/CpsF family)
MSSEINVAKVLDVQINALNMPLAVETIEGWIDHDDRRYVCICTVHTVMECQRDPALKNAINAAGLRTPDGMPLVWLSQRAGQESVSRVYGPDLMLELAKRSAKLEKVFGLTKSIIAVYQGVDEVEIDIRLTREDGCESNAPCPQIHQS